MGNKNLVWLASYPKSGNTWFRAFLTALFSENKSVDINNLAFNDNMADSSFFEYATNQNILELKPKEIEDLKPEVMSYLASLGNDFLPVKIHDRFRLIDNNKPLIPIPETKIVLYFIRNPLDVVVSYANHDNLSFDRIIERMNEDYILANLKNKEFFNIPETIGSWSEHVNSWTQISQCPVHVVRYEDMLLKGQKTFETAIKAIDLIFSESDVSKAIKTCSFAELKKQEKLNPFNEKSSVAKSFFFKGKVGNWRNLLNTKQVNKIIKDHNKVMNAFGYLDDNQNPIF